MTIHELLQAAGLTANDEIPIWDVDGTGEPTKKITAQQLAAAVVALANLVTGVKGGAEDSYRHGDVNLTPANIGAAKADSEFYTAIGDIVKSYSDAGTTVGYGMAFVSIRGKTVTVEFEAQITTAGSVSTVYDIGISVEKLRTLNSSIPAFNASDGIIHYFKSTGEIDTYHEGYVGVGKAVTNQQRWNFSRLYTTSGDIGPWGDSTYTSSGTRIMGTLYGTLT